MKLKKGKGFLYIFSLLPLLLGFAWAASEEGKTARPDQAKVTLLQGRADVLAKGTGEGKPLRVGSLLDRDDEVRTAEKSRIEIQLPDQSILRFDQRSQFKIKTLWFDDKEGGREVKVDMGAGKTWANVRKVFGSKKTFEVASANAVAGVRDTVWRMNVGEDRSTMIRVYEGTVEVYNPFVRAEVKPEEGGFQAPREVKGPQEVPRPYQEVSKEQWEQIVLTQMMQVLVPATGRPETPASFTAQEDQKEEWVRWNQQRDKGIKR